METKITTFASVGDALAIQHQHQRNHYSSRDAAQVNQSLSMTPKVTEL